MSESLIRSVEGLLHSKKVGHGQVRDILSILQVGKPLFENKNWSNLPQNNSSSVTKSELQRLNKEEVVLKIIETVSKDFEGASLPNDVSVKNYLVFLVVIFKLSKKLKDKHKRSLVMASTLSKLNQMFARHPIAFDSRMTREPLGLLYIITELAVEANKGIEIPYLFDETTLEQFVPLMKRFCTDYENPLAEMVTKISEMPKFRINSSIDKDHEQIFGYFLQFCFPKIAGKTRMQTGLNLFSKIITEESDSKVLLHYNTLKLLLTYDKDLEKKVIELATINLEKTKHRRFVNGIIEELTGKTS